MRYYVYRHVRLDTGTPFYVGKGQGRRNKKRDNRNRRWHEIVDKSNYTVQIVKYFESESEAFNFERLLIAIYRKYSLCEANLTSGGQGASGLKKSKETIEKLRKVDRSYTKTEEFKKTMSEASKGSKNGMYGKVHSDESKAKIGNKRKGVESPMKGIPKSKEQIEKMRIRAKERFSDPKNNVMYGKRHSEESKKRMSEAQKGEKSWSYGKRGSDSHNYGKKASEETKKKMSEMRKGKCNIPPQPGKSNPRWKGYCITPNGIFETVQEACKALKMNKKTLLYFINSEDHKDWYRTKEL